MSQIVSYFFICAVSHVWKSLNLRSGSSRALISQTTSLIGVLGGLKDMGTLLRPRDQSDRKEVSM